MRLRKTTDLGLGSVLVESSETGKVLRWDAGRILLADEGIRVGWVSDYHHLSKDTVKFQTIIRAHDFWALVISIEC